MGGAAESALVRRRPGAAIGVAAIGVACIGLALPGVARAQAPADTAPRELPHDLRADLPIVLLGGATWITTEALKVYLAPETCRWCDRDGEGTDSLNALDAAFRGSLGSADDRAAANTASHVTAFGLAPAAALGLDALAVAFEGGSPEDWAVDALVIAESAVIASNLNQLTKLAAGRERPFVHVLAADDKASTAQPADNNLSFFSGHTTLAFSLAVASGTVATLRGYRMAPVVWATGLATASMTGWLRIAADKHYFTDVLAGMLVGSAVGVAVPVLHAVGSPAQSEAAGVYASPLPSGIALGLHGEL